MPLGNDVVVTAGGVRIVIDRGCAAEVSPELSFTVTLKVEVPLAVGGPPIVPLKAFSDNPAGNDPDATVQLL